MGEYLILDFREGRLRFRPQELVEEDPVRGADRPDRLTLELRLQRVTRQLSEGPIGDVDEPDITGVVPTWMLGPGRGQRQHS